jgi:hypothetical protein
MQVHVIDEQYGSVRASYEIIRMDDRAYVGLGFGTDEQAGEPVSTWILRPGLYKIIRVGETYRARRDFFTVRVEGMNPKVSPGSGREIRFVATRREGFEGPIRMDLDRLPAGFTASTPVEIEAGQIRAVAVLYAGVGAADPQDAADRAVRVSATAEIQGREVRRELGDLGNVQLDAAPKLTVEILPGPDRSVVRQESGRPLELLIRPGQTITARVRADRRDFKSRIELGGEDSGRNLPHGVYVDNIGLNGLLIVEDQTEREFFITAARKARPGTRLFHLRANGDGGQCSQPVLLRILEASPGQ